MTGFAELGLHERLLKGIEACSMETPTEVQSEAIPQALAGHDLRVTARTGSGKTAAFALPLLQHLLLEPKPLAGTRALILSPTRELASQLQKQVQALAGFTFIQSEVVTGGEDFKVQAARIRKNPEILVGTPGRLLEHLEAGNLALADLAVLVIDEADRMLDLGFGEDVSRLAAACPEQRHTWLFSATPGDANMERLVRGVLREPRVLALHTVREIHHGIRQQVITADDAAHKERLTQWLLAHETYAKAMVFTNTRVQADRLGGVLRATARNKVYVLHGEKAQKERKQAMDRLRNGDVDILVATDVAARGLDVSGLDLVINFDMPRSGDDYVHRIGRTGRLGGEGVAVSLVSASEWNLMASIQRYLDQQFEFRIIEPLKARYQGPKKRRADGRAVGSKSKKLKRKAAAKSGVKGTKAAKGAKKAANPRRKAKPVAQELKGGHATLKRKPRSQD